VKFSIGKVAKTFGFTKEALRHYERTGVLPSFRDENGYRYYETAQLQRMGIIKRMQNIGFPLKEISALLTDYSEERLFDELEKSIQKREMELRYQSTILKKLKEDTAFFKDTANYNTPAIIDIPERYAFYFDNVERLVNDTTIRSDVIRWYDHMYPALGLESLPYERLGYGFPRRIGLLIDAEDARASGFPVTPQITVFAPCRAVQIITKFHLKENFFEWLHSIFSDFAQQNGLCYQGDVHLLYNFSYIESDGNLTMYITIYVPIKE
jgi:MerR family mercuric resistance operon transcriptional regulator